MGDLAVLAGDLAFGYITAMSKFIGATARPERLKDLPLRDQELVLALVKAYPSISVEQAIKRLRDQGM
jgi:hypothetical protein